MTKHYVFNSEAIKEFEYCPYCGGAIMQIYPGDYAGFVQCFNCEEAEDKLSFYILEEMIDRHPAYIFDLIRKPYEEELGRMRELLAKQAREKEEAEEK